jgi:hypothetical protein
VILFRSLQFPRLRMSLSNFLTPDDDTLQFLSDRIADLRASGVAVRALHAADEVHGDHHDHAPEACAPSSSGATSRRRESAATLDSATLYAFQLASLLLAHTDRMLLLEGISLMERVVYAMRSRLDAATRVTTTPASTAVPAAEECRLTLSAAHFFIAVGYYKLDEMALSRASTERMLEVDPRNPQGAALRDRIDETLLRRAAMGTAVAAVGALGVAGVVKLISHIASGR